MSLRRRSNRLVLAFAIGLAVSYAFQGWHGLVFGALYLSTGFAAILWKYRT